MTTHDRDFSIDSIPEKTAVAIIGAGASGLTLATLLQQSGIACVVLERKDRAAVEVRQRAGVVEARGVTMFQRWGLADKLLGGEVAQTIEYRLNGIGRVFTIAGEDGAAQGLFCTQQMLVNNLLKVLIDGMAGDVRFGAEDVTIQNMEGLPTQVIYSDASGSHKIRCDYIVGCDADRGVSRASIPEGVLTTYSHEFGYAWLAVLADVPRFGPAVMGASDRGFVSQIPRGPQKSRFYLQCLLSDGAADWPEERIWNEIRLRMGDDSIQDAPILTMEFVPLRSVVHVPLQHRNLFLVGDAAHLLPPTAGKGMNLALHDVDLLAPLWIATRNPFSLTSGTMKSSAPG